VHVENKAIDLKVLYNRRVLRMIYFFNNVFDMEKEMKYILMLCDNT